MESENDLKVCEACGHKYDLGETECPLCGYDPEKEEYREAFYELLEEEGNFD